MSIKALIVVLALISVAIGFALPDGGDTEAQPRSQVQFLDLG